MNTDRRFLKDKAPAPAAPTGGGGATLQHNSSHQDGGSDELNVAGLSGELADPQPSLAHDIITGHTFPGGTSGFLRADGTFATPPSSPPSAATPPGGSDTEVQFNDGGSFGGDSNFTYVKATKSLYVGSLAAILPGAITRAGQYVSTVVLSGGRTLTIARVGNYISSITDGTKTWTFTRTNNLVSSWAVA